MENALVNLSDGGSAVIITAPGFDCPRPFNAHPQLCVLASADLPIHGSDIATQFPPNTRLVVIGGELPRPAFMAVRTVAERRHLPWLQRNDPAGLTAILAKVLAKTTGQEPAEAAPETDKRKRGPVAEFVQAEADLTKGAAEEARRLFVIAQQRGLQTTLGSLSQAIGNAKRKAGATGVPKSIQPASVKALDTLQDSIAGLQLLTEYITTVEKENIQLRADRDAIKARLKKAQAMMQDLSAD